MHLGIYSLKKILFEGEAVSLNCKTLSGEITVLQNHEPLISVLQKGLMKIIDKDGKISYIRISSGFLEVQGGGEVKAIVEEESR